MRDLEAFYRRYNTLCNEHRFDGLGEFAAGRIAEVWVTADNLRILDQLR